MTTMEPSPGRRERKKAATRRSIGDAALRLSLERGFDHVTVAQIADEADVSVSTLFQHFPSKEAMLFDDDTARESALLDAVRLRGAGRSALTALREHIGSRVPPGGEGDPDLAQFRALVARTPALVDYARAMWVRHEVALAAVLADELDRTSDDLQVRALAHFCVSAHYLVEHDDAATSARDTDLVFDLITLGAEHVFGA